MTADRFDAELAARGITPDPRDRTAARQIAEALAEALRRLREAETARG